MTQRITRLLLFLILMTAGLSPVAAHPSSPAPLFDLTLFIPPPPAQNSDETKAELAEILRIQKNRTPEMVQAAQADSDETGFSFADVMGSAFTPENLPLTAALLKQIREAESSLTGPAKDYYHRPRPFDFDSRVEPCVPKPKSFSYPSGHSTGGTAMAVILARMVPEKKDILLARGKIFGENRIVGGVHYRSDVVAGEQAGVLLAAALLRDEGFRKDYEKAKLELRGVLGLK
jgi:acid phosphatase (class A)